MMATRRATAVFVGGGLGACCRVALLQALAAWGSPFPLMVLLINLLGAFILGIVFVLADEAGLMRGEARLFVAVGVLGGFTTFSTFVWGADLLVGQGLAVLAFVYVVASLGGGLLAVAAGLVSGREMVTVLERIARGVLVRLEHGRRGSGVPHEDMALIETENREESA